MRKRAEGAKGAFDMASACRAMLRSRFIRFVLVGGLNTVFGYSLFAVAILCGLPYPIASLLSTVCGVLFNFKSYGMLVFNSRDNRLILRFVAVYAVCYIVGLVPLAVAKAQGRSILLVGAVCALPLAGLAFGLNRWFVFGRARPVDLKGRGCR